MLRAAARCQSQLVGAEIVFHSYLYEQEDVIDAEREYVEAELWGVEEDPEDEDQEIVDLDDDELSEGDHNGSMGNRGGDRNGADSGHDAMPGPGSDSGGGAKLAEQLSQKVAPLRNCPHVTP